MWHRWVRLIGREVTWYSYEPVLQILSSWLFDPINCVTGVFLNKVNLGLDIKGYDILLLLSIVYSTTPILQQPHNSSTKFTLNLLRYFPNYLRTSEFYKMHSFIQYATKLGYTADDAEVALLRLGHHATTNELLNLVISLKSATSARRNDVPGKRKALPKPKRCLGFKLESLSYVADCSW